VSELAAFLAVAALVIVTPGQDTALTIRNTLIGDRRAGVLTGLGVSLGQVTWTVATSAGLAALLIASEPAFLALKLAGAAYLVYLGAQALWSAVTGRAHIAAAEAGSGPRLSGAGALRQGLLSNLGNPKMIAFFSSLLPQFAPGEPSFISLLALGLVFALMTFCWLSLYAVVVARAGDLLRRSRVRRTIEAATGAVLVALGLRLATTRP
jgi:threonine/homoserine/homoserine lactone efflux protein